MRKENAYAVRTLSKNRTRFSFQTCHVLTHAPRQEPNTDIASSSTLVGLLCMRAHGTGSAHYLLTSVTWCKIMTSCCLEGSFSLRGSFAECVWSSQVVCSHADIDLVERDPQRGRQRGTEEQLISGISTSYLLRAGKRETLTCSRHLTWWQGN